MSEKPTDHELAEELLAALKLAVRTIRATIERYDVFPDPAHYHTMTAAVGKAGWALYGHTDELERMKRGE